MGKSKTFVVAGAAGRRGAAARHLVKGGNKVIGITHTPSKVGKLESTGLIALIADLRDQSTFVSHLKDIDGFFIVTDPFARSKETEDMSVWVKDEVLQGERALVEWLAKQKKKRKSKLPQRSVVLS